MAFGLPWLFVLATSLLRETHRWVRAIQVGNYSLAFSGSRLQSVVLSDPMPQSHNCNWIVWLPIQLVHDSSYFSFLKKINKWFVAPLRERNQVLPYYEVGIFNIYPQIRPLGLSDPMHGFWINWTVWSQRCTIMWTHFMVEIKELCITTALNYNVLNATLMNRNNFSFSFPPSVNLSTHMRS